jgi:hypothetical protein
VRRRFTLKALDSLIRTVAAPGGAACDPEALAVSDSPEPTRLAVDHNLLFGILALQMDFISRDALIQAMNVWVLEKTKGK